MVVEPELHPIAGCRIVQVDLTALLEIMRGHLVGVRHDTVNDLDSVTVGFMLVVASDTVEYRCGEETQHFQKQYQQG